MKFTRDAYYFFLFQEAVSASCTNPGKEQGYKIVNQQADG